MKVEELIAHLFKAQRWGAAIDAATQAMADELADAWDAGRFAGEVDALAPPGKRSVNPFRPGGEDRE